MKGKILALLRDRARMRELVMYLIFGVLTTLVSWGTYYLWRQMFGLTAYTPGSSAYLLIANSGQVMAFVLSVAFAFFTNKRYVFRSERTAENGLWKELGLFVSSRILAAVLFDILLFNVCLMLLRNTALNADLWVKLVMNVLVVVFNYVASKFVIFKK